MSFSVPWLFSWGAVIRVPCTVSSVNTPLPDKLPSLLLYLVIWALLILIMTLLKHDRCANYLYCQTLLQPQYRGDVSTCITLYIFLVGLKQLVSVIEKSTSRKLICNNWSWVNFLHIFLKWGWVFSSSLMMVNWIFLGTKKANASLAAERCFINRGITTQVLFGSKDMSWKNSRG